MLALLLAHLLLLLAPVAASTAAAASSTSAAGPPPLNLLFLLIDDLGSNDMGWSQQLNGFSTAGAKGQPGVKTPTIDAMARSGIILNEYYVDTVCSPTRATCVRCLSLAISDVRWC
jgi:hypothetical protein